MGPPLEELGGSSSTGACIQGSKWISSSERVWGPGTCGLGHNSLRIHGQGSKAQPAESPGPSCRECPHTPCHREGYPVTRQWLGVHGTGDERSTPGPVNPYPIKVSVGFIMKQGTRTKINELDIVPAEVYQDVLILDVAMDNSTGMAVPNGCHYLGKEAVVLDFIQWALLCNVVKPVITPRCTPLAPDFHNSCISSRHGKSDTTSQPSMRFRRIILRSPGVGL